MIKSRRVTTNLKPRHVGMTKNLAKVPVYGIVLLRWAERAPIVTTNAHSFAALFGCELPTNTVDLCHLVFAGSRGRSIYESVHSLLAI